MSVPEKWLYIFPEAKHAPLNDKNLFVVAQRISFDADLQKDLFKKYLNCFSGPVTPEMLFNKSADINDHSLLANLVRVIIAAGVWDFTLGAENFVLVQSDDSSDAAKAFFIDVDRPAFGGGNPFNFFHKKDRGQATSEEIAFNARVGLAGLAVLLNHQNGYEL